MERPLTARLRHDGMALGLAGYERAGGYQALRRALREMSPAEVQKVVGDSGLRGRGGAGFPTGAKWSFVPMGSEAERPKYLVVNGDEMEPGTFKDRVLLEGDPHQLLEGVALAAYAIGAEIAVIFLRAEYTTAAGILAKALADAEAAGYLGAHILGSPFSLSVRLHTSAGRYICGEETGLLNSLQGKRAMPRAKPPFPQVSGLYGKPTIVNNVETLCNIPHIVNRGAEWFKSLSLCRDGGTKLYGVSGRVRRPGVWELPLGTSLREILEEHAGGMQPGYAWRGLLPGGASTDFLVPAQAGLAMDFDSVQQAGSRLGTGTIILLDDHTCPLGFVHNLIRFFARESCGWCTPCREGLPWVEQILAALEQGRGEEGDLAVLAEHTRLLGPGLTHCALAPGAMEPLQSALRHFAADFQAHLRDGRCPWS